jgi:hypothetical protein
VESLVDEILMKRIGEELHFTAVGTLHLPNKLNVTSCVSDIGSCSQREEGVRLVFTGVLVRPGRGR